VNAEKANIQNSMDAAEIPEYVFESLARNLLPVIQKYYESEGGKKAFAEWKAKKEISDSAST
jgi:septum formation topological specificity factor MinE